MAIDTRLSRQTYGRGYGWRLAGSGNSTHGSHEGPFRSDKLLPCTLYTVQVTETTHTASQRLNRERERESLFVNPTPSWHRARALSIATTEEAEGGPRAI